MNIKWCFAVAFKQGGLDCSWLEFACPPCANMCDVTTNYNHKIYLLGCRMVFSLEIKSPHPVGMVLTLFYTRTNTENKKMTEKR